MKAHSNLNVRKMFVHLLGLPYMPRITWGDSMNVSDDEKAVQDDTNMISLGATFCLSLS